MYLSQGTVNILEIKGICETYIIKIKGALPLYDPTFHGYGENKVNTYIGIKATYMLSKLKAYFFFTARVFTSKQN